VTTPDWDAVPYAGPPSSEPQQPAPSWPPPQPWGQPPAGQQWPAQQQAPAQPWGPPPWTQPQGAQPPWAQPSWGQPPWGQQPWGQQPWGPPPGWQPRPQRSTLLVSAAVLAFVSALLVLVGTVYAMAFSALLSLARGPSTGVGAGTAVTQLALAGLLVVGGVRVLGGSRWWLLGAAALQLALSLYWVVVLGDVAPSTLSEGVFVLPLLYGVLALLAGGLPFLPEVQRWLRQRTGRGRPGPQAAAPPEPQPGKPPWA
jgi:hypothetical protein